MNDGGAGNRHPPTWSRRTFRRTPAAPPTSLAVDGARAACHRRDTPARSPCRLVLGHGEARRRHEANTSRQVLSPMRAALVLAGGADSAALCRYLNEQIAAWSRGARPLLRPRRGAAAGRRPRHRRARAPDGRLGRPRRDRHERRRHRPRRPQLAPFFAAAERPRRGDLRPPAPLRNGAPDRPPLLQQVLAFPARPASPASLSPRA